MIGRILALGRSFKKLISYLKTGKDGRQSQRDRVEWVEFRNLPTRNPDTAACMMAATASESVSATQTAVYHFSISCSPGDPVDGGTLRRVADRTIRDLGLEEYQVLIFAHKDRSHPHLHFVVNRVHPERGTLWRTWRDYYRIERSLRAQEQELGLQIVPGWNSVVVRDVDGGLRVPEKHETGLQRVFPRSAPRRGDTDFLRDVTARAAPVLEQARSWAELERGLAEQGLALRAKGGGFTLTDGTRQVKASELGRECSRYHLEKRLGAYPDYRARVAVAEIPPAPRVPVVQPDAAPPQGPAPVETQAPARQQQPAPVPARRRPQFGDAGHGIHELFSDTTPLEVEAAPVPGRSPDPQPRRKAPTFLREVQERAGPVLERASSWAEVERGLGEHGLFLREKGGGFVVTDGEREVKASEVGRAFSRFHLEKRLGHYSDSRARGAGEEVAPVPPALAVEPVPAARQADQLALPLAAPAVQEGKQAEARGAPRYTLHDDGTTFGVRDRDGQVFFAETRERALAEVERANVIAALYPDVISMRHLREMDSAWRDARGLPRLPEPSGRRIVVPAQEAIQEGGPPIPPVARVQREAPAPDASPAAPRDSTPTQPPEQAAMPTRVPEPVTQPPHPQAVEPPVAPRPPVTQGPRVPAPPPDTTTQLPVRRPTRRKEPSQPLPGTVELSPLVPGLSRSAKPSAARRIRTAPPTERDKYREVVWSFRQKLAELYRDPRVARRAFDVELGRHGAESAIDVLAETPEQYGKLRLLARRERVVAAVPWVELYADWRRGSTRPAYYAAAELLERAALPYHITDARGAVHAAEHELAMLPDRRRTADAAETAYEGGLREVYRDPTAAKSVIEEHRRRVGADATAAAIENSPRRFGALRPNAEQGWLSRQWNGLDTSVAQGRAASLAHAFRVAQAAISRRPRTDDHLRASIAVVDAKHFAEALEERLARLPHKNSVVYAKEALRVIDETARASGRSGDHVTRQVRLMLPEQTIPFVVKALKAVDEHERTQQRAQERRLNPGHGFSL